MSESWHNRFSVVTARDHPRFYALLVELQKKYADTEIMLQELALGREIRRPENTVEIRIEERISNIVRNYETRKEKG